MITKIKTLIQTKQREIVRFYKFSVVGIIGAVVDFATYNLMIKAVHLSPEVASVIALATAIVSNFVWNRYWTYPDSRSKPVVKQFVQFFVVNIAGLVINTAIFYASDRWFLGEVGLLAGPVGALALAIGMAHFDLAYNGAKVIATGVVLFWNFFVNRIWTFRHVQEVDRLVGL